MHEGVEYPEAVAVIVAVLLLPVGLVCTDEALPPAVIGTTAGAKLPVVLLRVTLIVPEFGSLLPYASTVPRLTVIVFDPFLTRLAGQVANVRGIGAGFTTTGPVPLRVPSVTVSVPAAFAL